LRGSDEGRDFSPPLLFLRFLRVVLFSLFMRFLRVVLFSLFSLFSRFALLSLFLRCVRLWRFMLLILDARAF
jgi:hypothetical protein